MYQFAGHKQYPSFFSIARWTVIYQWWAYILLCVSAQAHISSSMLVIYVSSANNCPLQWSSNPIGSMYGILTYIWLRFMVNVGKYTIHGSYGNYPDHHGGHIDMSPEWVGADRALRESFFAETFPEVFCGETKRCERAFPADALDGEWYVKLNIVCS